MQRFIRLLLCVLLCEGVGIVGSIFTFQSVAIWYPTLTKPFFNPPSWIFGPVWTFLYFLMGFSLYLIWRKKTIDLKWFWVQLILNILWSIVFFGLRSPNAALVIIIFLLASIFFTIRIFSKINKRAAYLLYPYFVWVCFATLLNGAIVVLNI